MSLVTATHTLPTSETVTRRVLLERLLREGFGSYGTATSGPGATVTLGAELTAI